MRAVVFDAPNKGKVELKDVPVPTTPGENDLLVEVVAAGVNPVDAGIANFNFLGRTSPQVLGFDFSGVVRAVGKNVADFKIGDDVFGHCPLNLHGAYTSWLLVDQANSAIKPKAVSHAQAAALPVTFLSAILNLEDAKLKGGETLFVPGGAGGVGHMAVQIGHIHGCHVIASASRDDSIKFLQHELKVKDVFNYKKHKTGEEVKKLTKGLGADVVFDAIGGASLVESAGAVRAGGRYEVLGGAPKPDSDAGKIVLEAKAALQGASLGPAGMSGDRAVRIKAIQGNLKKAAEWAAAGKLKAHITKTITLDDVINEMTVQRGQSGLGKIVVQIKKE